MYQIDNAGAVGHGDYNGADHRAVFFLECGENGVKIAVLLVQLGDVENRGNASGLQILPAALCADGDAVFRRAEDNSGFDDADGGENFAGKVKVAGAVEHIDLAAAEINGRDGGGDCDLALDLFSVIVADGVAVSDLAHTVDSAGAEQHALGKAGLTAVAVTYEADVADVLGFVAHVLLPLCQNILRCKFLIAKFNQQSIYYTLRL